MTEEEELAHLHAPSPDPKQRMIDYWGHRAEKAEAEIERLQADNARLRAALALAEKALTLRGPGWPLDEVRRALGGK